jgi:hypothetical protein
MNAADRSRPGSSSHDTVTPHKATEGADKQISPLDTLTKRTSSPFPFGDEKQVEKALEKIIDYVENAGEITLLQKSLLEIHKNILDHTYDTTTIDRRLALVSERCVAVVGKGLGD